MQAAEARLPVVAPYSAAASAWRNAAGAAAEAAARAAAGEAEARARAEGAVAEAQDLLRRVQAAAAHAGLKPDSRLLLSRAQLAVAESEALEHNGDHLGAAARAEWAVGAGRQLAGETSSITARYAEAELVATWLRWKERLIARSRTEGQPAILVEKADHRLTLYVNGRATRVYQIELGPNWIPAKRHAGDAATPEGEYQVAAKKGPGASTYHKALLLNYPNERDREAFTRDRRNGLLPPAARLGGLIEIHGGGGRGEDWTSGCVAMSNEDIDRLYDQVQVGAPVTITGGDWRELDQRITASAGDAQADRRGVAVPAR
jgi:lipoprotein-anchoring transpeptidase ErfK/SrfK